jgi:DNA-binding transcriptional MerR regulator
MAQAHVYQKADGAGFTFEGRTYEGFKDHVHLPVPVRAQVARWAVARKVANGWQQWLAELPLAPTSTEEDSELARWEEGFLDSEAFKRILAGMDVPTQMKVLRPEGFLGRRVAWPLRVSEVARLFPQISAKQLRDWDWQGLVRACGRGKGNYRGYYRSQLVVALLVDKLLRAKWSMQRIKEVVGLEPNEMVEVAQDLKAVLLERDHQTARLAVRRVVGGGDDLRRARTLPEGAAQELREQVAKTQGKTARQPAAK